MVRRLSREPPKNGELKKHDSIAPNLYSTTAIRVA